MPRARRSKFRSRNTEKRNVPHPGSVPFFNVPAVLHAACSNRPSRSLSRGSPARRFSMGSRRPFAFLFPAVHASALAALFPRQPAPASLSSLSYCLGCNRSLLAPAAHPRPHAPACSHPPRRSAPVAAPVPGRAKKESGSLRTAPRIVPLRATTPGPPAAPQPKGYSSSGSFMLW